MMLCDDHTKQCHDALKELGLWSQVGQTRDEAIAKLRSHRLGDPNIHVQNEVIAQCTKIIVECVSEECPDIPVAMIWQEVPNAIPGCPLCHVISRCQCKDGPECTFRKWPVQCANAIAHFWTKAKA